MLKKYKGFTLLELLVSMVLLTFVILISSTLFDSAIKDTPILGRTMQADTQAVSDMDNAMVKAEQYIASKDSPDSPPVEKVKLNTAIKIMDKSYNEVQGYFVSENMIKPADFGKNSAAKVRFDTKINDVSPDDTFVSFVGFGHDPTPTSGAVIAISPNQPRFIFTPLLNNNGNDLQKITENFSKLKFKFAVVPDKEQKKFFGLRYGLTKANKQFLNQDILTNDYNDIGTITNSYIEAVEDAGADVGKIINMKDNGGVKYSEIDDMGFLPEFDKNKWQDYLPYIDQTYAVSGYTLNENSHIGDRINSFSRSFTSEGQIKAYKAIDDGTENVMTIGIPYTKDMAKLYDFDLMQALATAKYDKYDIKDVSVPLLKSLSSNYSLNSPYDEFISSDGTVDFKDNLDVFDMFGNYSNGNEIYVKDNKKYNYVRGNTVISNLDEINNRFKISNGHTYGYKNPCGYSLFFNYGEENENQSILSFGAGLESRDNSGRTATFIIKFNPESYSKIIGNRDEKNAFVLFSSNLNKDGTYNKSNPIRAHGGIIYGFAVYVDENGGLRANIGKARPNIHEEDGNSIIYKDYPMYYRYSDVARMSIDFKTQQGAQYNVYKENLYNKKTDQNKDYIDSIKGYNLIAMSFIDNRSGYNDVTFYVLKRDTTEKGEIFTRMAPLYITTEETESAKVVVGVDNIYFDQGNEKFKVNVGQAVDNLIKTNVEKETRTYTDVNIDLPRNNDFAIEISDMMYFTNGIHMMPRDKLLPNMNYMFKKYLTPEEYSAYKDDYMMMLKRSIDR